MNRNFLHAEDDQLLLYAEGELQNPAREAVVAHVESCARCKARLQELRASDDNFAQLHQSTLNLPLPSAAGPRALLKAQLANLSPEDRSTQGYSTGAPWLPWRMLATKRVGLALAGLAVLVVVFARVSDRSGGRDSLKLSDRPNSQFTPGAVISATLNQVCSESSEDSASIPLETKNKVLQLYGVASSQGDTYEVDYLITPQLGGATDVRNLWPEPYEHTEWNAHVKDQLESRLHQMVCSGDIDLATAQRDISTDWIAAYRKYFHSQEPILRGSS